jgi:predicted  nucleic acid-binding Zn-ribbon protein
LAEQAGAGEDAPLQIASARQKLKTARAAMAKEDYITAMRLTEQAQIEAELAQAKAQSATAQRALQQVRESIRLLREEIMPGTEAS